MLRTLTDKTKQGVQVSTFEPPTIRRKTGNAKYSDFVRQLVENAERDRRGINGKNRFDRLL